MASLIPKEYIQDIIDKTNIVNYVEQYTKLKRGGARGELSGRCPLPGHDDKSPSFYVNEAKQSFCCHGCGAGGGIVNFIKQYHGKDFVSTIEELADFNNEKVPYVSTGKKGGSSSATVQDYRRVYDDLFAIGKAGKINNECFNELLAKIGVSSEVAESFDIVPISKSVIRKVALNLSEDKRDIKNNLLSSISDLPDADYAALPIRSYYSNHIDGLHLFDSERQDFLPAKPAMSLSKLIHGSQKINIKRPPETIILVESPVDALCFQSGENSGNTKYISTVAGFETISRAALRVFEKDENILCVNDFRIRLDLSDPGIHEKVQQLLKSTSRYAARLTFDLCDDFHVNTVPPSASFSYVELLEMSIESHLEQRYGTNSSAFPESAIKDHLESLLGGEFENCALLNYIRQSVLEKYSISFEKETYFSSKFSRPSNNQQPGKSILVDATQREEAKTAVNSVIHTSMTSHEDVTEKAISEYIQRAEKSNNQLLKSIMQTAKYLHATEKRINISTVLDNTSEEARTAYLSR